MESLSSSMGLNRTFQGWVLPKSSFCTCQLFVPVKPVSWHHGVKGLVTATPEQPWRRSSCCLTPLPPPSSLHFPVFQFSLVVLIIQHKLFICFTRDYCKGSGTPHEGISSLTLSQAEPDLTTSTLHPFLVKTFLGSFRRGHLGLRAGKTSVIKEYNEMKRSRRWRQKTFRLTGAVWIKRNFALLWMCEDFCQEVAMVTFQLSQTSSYCNYISKSVSWESLILWRKNVGGWLFRMFFNQPFLF